MNSNKQLSWHSPLIDLYGAKTPKSVESLTQAGFNTLFDLLWLLPLRLQSAPEVKPFSEMRDGELFLGKAKLVNMQLTPVFGRRGKGNIQLFNASVIIQDSLSPQTMTLKWFNTYPSFKNQFKPDLEFLFLGEVKSYKTQLQMTNPKINPKEAIQQDGMLIEYPTVNGVSGKNIKNIFDKFPENLWETQINSLVDDLKVTPNSLPLTKAFQGVHGKLSGSEIKTAKERLIFEEFFLGQLKVLARKLRTRALKAKPIEISKDEKLKLLALFPYEFTDDQLLSLSDIEADLKQDHPMMRMIQGDVGCGKTSVALMAAFILAQNKFQIAFMCPTETLARQHYKTLLSLESRLKIGILVGSQKAKERKEILNSLQAGSIDIIIGTHALIQDQVEFKNLGLAIIDEQHKFGVKQRQKLISKGEAVHSLIMSATPIPRTLQLAQYGDLDISSIHTIPSGRKGTKTRIVTTKTHRQYLSFLKTRLEMKEQIYIVAPAIEESEHFDVNNVKEIESEYKKYFPEFSIQAIHGQLKAEVKNEIMEDFKTGKVHILISTTVIEVGIDVPNSTVISIFNPERFGLSSLHQLRGRVGRGEKPGFCFLITDDSTSKEAIDRLKIVEQTTDGFSIAEADLKNRGQGELFGASQSGYQSEYHLANIFEHRKIFDQVSRNIQELEKTETEKLNNILLNLVQDKNISSTI